MCMHTYINTYKDTYKVQNTHSYIRANVHTQIMICVWNKVHTYKHTYIQTYNQSACVCVRARARVHICVCMCVIVYVCVFLCLCLCLCVHLYFEVPLGRSLKQYTISPKKSTRSIPETIQNWLGRSLKQYTRSIPETIHHLSKKFNMQTGLCIVRTWILSGFKFTKHFIEFIFVDTYQFFSSNPSVIYVRNVRPALEHGCGDAAGSKRRFAASRSSRLNYYRDWKKSRVHKIKVSETLCKLNFTVSENPSWVMIAFTTWNSNVVPLIECL